MRGGEEGRESGGKNQNAYISYIWGEGPQEVIPLRRSLAEALSIRLLLLVLKLSLSLWSLLSSTDTSPPRWTFLSTLLLRRFLPPARFRLVSVGGGGASCAFFRFNRSSSMSATGR